MSGPGRAGVEWVPIGYALALVALTAAFLWAMEVGGGTSGLVTMLLAVHAVGWRLAYGEWLGRRHGRR